jgi:hypothetical protein
MGPAERRIAAGGGAHYPAPRRIPTMSADLRNSIALWAGGLLYFGFFWAGLQLDLFRGISGTWLGVFAGAVGAVQLIRFGWGLWQRRASNPSNPNRLG